jgi:hypothetical protein
MATAPMPQHWNYGRPSGRSKHGARNEKKLDLDLHASRPNASRPALVTSQETFPVTLGSNRSNALPAAASSPVCSSTVKSRRERRPRFRRWLVIWVQVEATQEEIALIAQAARKLGLTPSQFVTRAAASLRSKQKSQRAADRDQSLLGKTKLPLRKRKSR